MRRVSIAQEILATLWWSSFRRPFEGMCRRVLSGRKEVLVGPLKGRPFPGGLSEVLGIYELHVQEALAGHLKRGATFFDVGANNGYFTLFASVLVGDTGSVFAFEPHPENAGRIRLVVEKNSLVNVEVVEAAVTHSEGTVRIQEGRDRATPALVPAHVHAPRSIEVAAVALDAFVADHLAPGVVLVDVEGAEADVLAGSALLLRGRERPAWIVELHSQRTQREVEACFAAAEYDTAILPSRRGPKLPVHLLAVPRDSVR